MPPGRSAATAPGFAFVRAPVGTTAHPGLGGGGGRLEVGDLAVSPLGEDGAIVCRRRRGGVSTFASLGRRPQKFPLLLLPGRLHPLQYLLPLAIEVGCRQRRGEVQVAALRHDDLIVYRVYSIVRKSSAQQHNRCLRLWSSTQKRYAGSRDKNRRFARCLTEGRGFARNFPASLCTNFLASRTLPLSTYSAGGYYGASHRSSRREMTPSLVASERNTESFRGVVFEASLDNAMQTS